VGPDNYFPDPSQLAPSLDLPLENLDEDLVYCLHRVSFVFLSHFDVVVLILINYSISQALALSGKQCEKRATESAQMAKIVKLEVVMRSQADMIAELEATRIDLKREKDKVTDGYRRLSEKHKAHAERAEQDKMKHAKAHAIELTELRGDLDLGTCSYKEYHQTMRRWLHELHEVVASSFDEVKVRCLPFPNKVMKVEEMIDRVIGEVKTVPDTVWRLNDNFVILGIKGILSMLNGEGCQELGRLHDLAGSCDAAVLEDDTDDVHKLVVRIV
jgi:hypothetical protein